MHSSQALETLGPVDLKNSMERPGMPQILAGQPES